MTDELPVPKGDLLTRSSLRADLAQLGVRPGSVLLLHSSVSALGWVAGGPVAVVQALRDVLGPDGTLVVPTHTPGNSDPAIWRNPPVPESWWPGIRAEMPAFDPILTPSQWMGSVAELVRTWPGASRSDHPQTSFAGIGPAAAEITADHRLDSMLGEHSPLARVYALGGDVLLLGVGHGSNTSLHLAEYRVPHPVSSPYGSAVLSGGERTWTWWDDVAVDEGDFEALGADFDGTGVVTLGHVGAAGCRLMSQRAAVDFAVGWLPSHRPSVGGPQ